MYIPAAFHQTDVATLHQFVRDHSFATLVSNSPDGPFASHLPLLLDAERGPQGTLVGHMARANPHWTIAAGQTTLAIFHGPHAYISPAWYEADNVVPTWNYLAVHASGTLRLIDDPARLQQLILRTVDTYESQFAAPWKLDSQSPEFVERLSQQVVGFEIEIERLEGKWKLSQNHSADRRAKVAAALRNAGDETSSALADLMRT